MSNGPPLGYCGTAVEVTIIVNVSIPSISSLKCWEKLDFFYNNDGWSMCIVFMSPDQFENFWSM